MYAIQYKITRHAKKQVNMIHELEKNQLSKTYPGGTQMLNDLKTKSYIFKEFCGNK